MSKPTIAAPAHRTIAAILATTALLYGGLLASGAALAASIEVHVTNISNAKGQIRVAVCDQERFLKQCVHTASAPAQAGETVLKVANVPAGTPDTFSTVSPACAGAEAVCTHCFRNRSWSQTATRICPLALLMLVTCTSMLPASAVPAASTVAHSRAAAAKVDAIVRCAGAAMVGLLIFLSLL